MLSTVKVRIKLKNINGRRRLVGLSGFLLLNDCLDKKDPCFTSFFIFPFGSVRSWSGVAL